MNINPQVYEDEIKRNKAIVAQYEALNRLRSTRDFKAVIMEGYLKSEAVRLVHLRTDPSMQTPAKQEEIMKQIDGIGAFISFMYVLEQMGIQALKNIDTAEANLEELREDDGNEE